MKKNKLKLEEIKKNYYAEREFFDKSINEDYILQARKLKKTDKEAIKFIELLEERNRIACLLEDTLYYINVEIDMEYIEDRIDNPEEYKDDEEELFDVVDNALYGNLYSEYFENTNKICTTLVEALSILDSAMSELESYEHSYTLVAGIADIEECVDYLFEHYHKLLEADEQAIQTELV